MKKIITLISIGICLSSIAFGQKPKPKAPNKVVFAVLNDGKTLEPIAKLENGKLLQTVSGGDDVSILTAFSKTYYKPKTIYNLIFGGNIAGTVSVVKNDPKEECSSNMAQAITKSTKAKLKDNVMALATNIKPAKQGSGVRRLPTAAERSEIEKLVAAEFIKNKVSGKNLKFQNLTALDVDNDGKVELVGSFWTVISATERGLLFFIADKVRDNKYSLGYKEFRTIKQDEVMNGEIKTVDEGVYHELLLDALDFKDDGVAEIFTYIQSFEGASFTVYQRNEGTWEQVLETSNYHCGY